MEEMKYAVHRIRSVNLFFLKMEMKEFFQPLCFYSNREVSNFWSRDYIRNVLQLFISFHLETRNLSIKGSNNQEAFHFHLRDCYKDFCSINFKIMKVTLNLVIC